MPRRRPVAPARLFGALAAFVFVVTPAVASAQSTPAAPDLATTTTTTTEVPPVETPAPPPAPPAEPAILDGRALSGKIVAPADALSEVPLTSSGYDAARGARDHALGELAAADARVTALDRRADDLRTQVSTLDADLARLDGERSAAWAERDLVAHDLRAIAVARYTSDGVGLESIDTTAALTEIEGERVTWTMANGAIGSARDHLVELDSSLDTLERSIDATTRDRADAATELDGIAAQRSAAVAEVTAATKRVVAATATIGDERSNANVAGSDIGIVALDAYWRAARTLRAEKPSCGLQWWGIAGVGRSESHHGRFNGGAPARDGTVTVPVIGVALDGGGATRAVRDTDKGLLDGDPTTDRAVGPMQFIPGTWKRWGRDGSGDKVVDPQNMYDAALAAASYLCSGGGGLDGDAGLSAAYLRYNRDAAYVQTVLGYANAYRALPVPPN